jgi:hypothetical protein
MCNGIKVLVQRFKPWLDKYEWPDMTLPPIPIEFVAKKEFMRNAAQDLDLLSSAFDKDDMPLEQRSIYNAAKKKLMGVYSIVASDADITYIEQVAIMCQGMLTININVAEGRLKLTIKKEEESERGYSYIHITRGQLDRLH